MSLKDIRNGPGWNIWIVGILLEIISIVLISGHGVNLIAGYNTSSRVPGLRCYLVKSIILFQILLAETELPYLLTDF